MTLSTTVRESDVTEAVRMFKFSTMQAVQSGHVEGMTRGELSEEIEKVEADIRYDFDFLFPSFKITSTFTFSFNERECWRLI
jgi:hypothetical protein